jgi:2-hydroxychromene-2-carboxylate isomerase
MSAVIDYYFAPVSPFTYLGHERFIATARRHDAAIALKPIDLGKVFAVSGGLPLKQRAPQRQAYRLVELKRWSALLGVPFNPEPRYFPVSGDLAARFILAASERGEMPALALTAAIGRALWAEERNIAEEGTLRDIARTLQLPDALLAERAAAPDVTVRYNTLTQEAIDRGVFGAPTYVHRGELFWGQDRLDFLDRSLSK